MAIPSAIPHRLATRWSLQGFELIADTRTSSVHRVRRQNGTTAILKQLKPTGLHELTGMAYLGWRNGAGAVQLLERHGHACLLEDAGGETLRDHWRAHGDKACNQIIVRVLQELHRSSKEDTPAGLTPLRDHFGPCCNLPKATTDTSQMR